MTKADVAREFLVRSALRYQAAVMLDEAFPRSCEMSWGVESELLDDAVREYAPFLVD